MALAFPLHQARHLHQRQRLHLEEELEQQLYIGSRWQCRRGKVFGDPPDVFVEEEDQRAGH